MANATDLVYLIAEIARVAGSHVPKGSHYPQVVTHFSSSSSSSRKEEKSERKESRTEENTALFCYLV